MQRHQRNAKGHVTSVIVRNVVIPRDFGAVQPKTSPADKGFDCGIKTLKPRASSSGLAARIAEANWIVPARTRVLGRGFWRLRWTVWINRPTSMEISTKT
ncbi:hypothetical protein M0R45_026667 [Rubus argutus]|uniref:Uncharacterized protein n=1 Tax=Rubus argutus TaxID=59490 RepID=A0AAW1WY55_RUBAR